MERLATMLLEISVQAALVAGLVWILSRLLHKSPASWRHALWAFVLIKFFIPPILHVPSYAGSQHDANTSKNTVVRVISHSVGIVQAATNMSSRVPSRMLKEVSPLAIVTYAWLVGACLMTLRLGLRYRRHTSFFQSTTPVRGELLVLMEECALGFGVRRHPEIRLYDGD
jgi:beta-lactamase regulating signal transducer with metallopeptidase domain